MRSSYLVDDELAKLRKLIYTNAPFTGSETAKHIAVMRAEVDERGRIRLLHQIINRNLGLVLNPALRLRATGINRGLSLNDLFQNGVIGLQDAVNRYDNSRGVLFSTYAKYWIQAYIFVAINSSRPGMLPVTSARTQEIIRNLGYCRERLQREGIDDPTVDQVIARLVANPIRNPADTDKIHAAMATTYWSALSLDSSLDDNDSDGTSAHELIPNPDPDQDFLLARAALREMTNDSLSILSERDRRIVCQRFGLTEDGPMTLEMIGDQLSITKERVRQIVVRSIGRLREHLTSENDFSVQDVP